MSFFAKLCNLEVLELALRHRGLLVDRVLHQIVQLAAVGQVLRISGIDNLKQNFLQVCLVRLVLNDRRELYAVHFRRDLALQLVKQ